MNQTGINILAIEFGEFSEVERFNPGFRQRRDKIHTSIYLQSQMTGLPHFTKLMPEIREHFPMLLEHKCTTPLMKRDESFDNPSLRNKMRDEVPHLMEHIIIEILHMVGQMEFCHGVTCASRTKGGKYDIFVECEDPRLGRFGALAARSFIEDVMSYGNASPIWQYIIQSAEFLYPRSMKEASIRLLADSFGWPRAVIECVLEDLKILSFFHSSTGYS